MSFLLHEKSEIVPDSVLATSLKAEARRLGFELVGICPADCPSTWEHFREWLERGYAADMHYILRRRDAYAHPKGVLPGARYLVMLGLDYESVGPVTPKPGQGRVARYAWGTDYHTLIRRRLRLLEEFLLLKRPGARVRGVVDTAPLLERDFAHSAGLGWFGKNTMLINDTLGSRFFIGALLTDVDLEPDAPAGEHKCGDCTACLDACPTGALIAPHRLDARKCLNYWTIEAKGALPADIRVKLGDRFYGCEVCQDVCPFNSGVPPSSEPGFQFQEGLNPVDLVELFSLDAAAFSARFRQTPLWRVKRAGLLRNAAAVLANSPTPEGKAALVVGLNDSEPEVRAACDSALEHILRLERGLAEKTSGPQS